MTLAMTSPDASATEVSTESTASVSPATDGAPEKPQESASPPKPEKLAGKFAALARQEKQARMMQQQNKAALDKIAAFEADQKLKESDPFAWAQKHGIDYGKWTEKMISGSPVDKKDPIADEVKTLKEKLEQQEKAQAEREAVEAQKQVEQKTGQFKENLGSFLDKNKDKYEFAAAEGPDVMYEVIMEHYFDTEELASDGTVLKAGKLLSPDEAAALIDKYKEEEFENKYANLNRVKAKFSPKAPLEPESDEDMAQRLALASAQREASRPKTLSSAMSGSVPTMPAKSFHEMTDEEQFEYAIKRGQLR